ncbi:MAG: hypothetical protein ISR52_09905 [Rhodospirillales bacterium]|nr:hypothetical protein [Rhodospirillales bacterium]
MIDKNAKFLIDTGIATIPTLREQIRVHNILMRNLRLKKFWTVFVGGDPMYRTAYQAELDKLDAKLRELWQAWTVLFWKGRQTAAG